MMLELNNVGVLANGVVLVEPISLSLDKGQVLIILGETGSGKSLLAQAIMGALPKGLMAQGEVCFDGKILSDNDKKALWGKSLAMLAQEPTKSLDPTMSVGEQIKESYQFVKGLDNKTAKQNASLDLDKLGLGGLYERYPHQLSGGMNQRTAFAVARAGGASLLIADEPTKGLDSDNRQIVVDLLKQVVTDGGSVLIITHDIVVANRLAECDNARLMVMKKGKLLEQGNAKAILSAPTSDYAKALIGASPDNWQGKWQDKSEILNNNQNLVRLDDISLTRGKKTLFKGLTMDLKQGQIVGIVGQSGIGKSSLGDVLCGLLKPSGGQVVWANKPPRQKVLKLYQDPPSAFAPHLPIRVLLDDVIKKHKLDKARIPPLLDELGLSDELLNRTSQSVSGGELQRIAILRALLFDPVLLFADEVTSRLDPITQQETMNLLVRQCQAIGCTLVMVSHEQALVDFYCDEVVEIERFV